MKRAVAIRVLFLVVFLGATFSGQTLLGADVDLGFEIVKSCRKNMIMLREGTEKCIKETHPEIPIDVTPFDQVYTMVLTGKYIPQKPGSPTIDCKYSLVYKSPDNWDWFCAIHGVINGNETLTIPYHEFEFTVPFNTNFLEMKKYKSHFDNVMNWTMYSRTLNEAIKFHYRKNPTTTLIMVIVGAAFVWYVYRSIFD